MPSAPPFLGRCNMNRRIASTIILILASASLALAAQPSPTIEELLWWFPSDTETVWVAQTQPDNVKGPLRELMPWVNGKADFGFSFDAILQRNLGQSRTIALLD